MNNVFTSVVLTSYIVYDPFHSPVEIVCRVAYSVIKLGSFDLFDYQLLGCCTVLTSVVDFVVPYLVRDSTSASSSSDTSYSSANVLVGNGALYYIDTTCIL